jgi:hypothetical protein
VRVPLKQKINHRINVEYQQQYFYKKLFEMINLPYLGCPFGGKLKQYYKQRHIVWISGLRKFIVDDMFDQSAQIFITLFNQNSGRQATHYSYQF